MHTPVTKDQICDDEDLSTGQLRGTSCAPSKTRFSRAVQCGLGQDA